MIKRLVLVLITAFLLPACSHNPTTATANSSDHKTITRQQIADNHFHTAYEAVAALHSNWLQTRGTDSFQRPSEVLVIMNSNELGGVETLRNINAETVSFIRWYDGMEATSRWGVGHSAGVIFVSSHEE